MAKNNTFVLNGKKIKAIPFDYNLMCDLDEMGISLADISTKPNSFTRAYVALCLGVDTNEAGKEIEKHIVSGGSFEDIATAMGNEMSDSDFFQTLQKRAEEKNQ